MKIGAGAVLLGSIKIVDNSKIGANAVFLTDYPDIVPVPWSV